MDNIRIPIGEIYRAVEADRTDRSSTIRLRGFAGIKKRIIIMEIHRRLQTDGTGAS